MNVEKFIRTLGYIVYVALWSPVIVLGLLVMPFAWLIGFMRMGCTAKEAMKLYWKAMKKSIRHDIHFIKTGVWY